MPTKLSPRFKDPITRGLRISQGRLLRKQRLGYLNSPETREKMSIAKLGKVSWNKGKKMPKGMGEKMRKHKLKLYSEKKNHPRWLGGKSFEKYTKEFNNKLKLEIRIRDKFQCQLCEIQEKDCDRKLDINHIDYDKKNCNPLNLIALCRGCNAHVNGKREFWTKLFNDKVQRL